jgi:hypothetical protein
MDNRICKHYEAKGYCGPHECNARTFACSKWKRVDIPCTGHGDPVWYQRCKVKGEGEPDGIKDEQLGW